MRFRLGLTNFEHDAPLKCTCGNTFAARFFFDHAETCHKQFGLKGNARQRGVMLVLKKWIHLLTELLIELEQVVGAGRERPDALVFGLENQNIAMLEASIIHPASASTAVAAAEKPLSAAVKRETEKVNKYRALAEAENKSVIPFILESYGGVGPQAIAFICRALKQPRRFEKCITFRMHKRIIMHALSVELQYGNARMLAVAAGRVSTF